MLLFSIAIPALAQEETLAESDIALVSDLAPSEAKAYVSHLLSTYALKDLTADGYLQQGFSLVFLIEGAGRSDDPAQRQNALCVVVRLNEDGQPAIVYENDLCTTLPDHPKSTYNAQDCATLVDGVYALYTANREESGVLALAMGGAVPVIRFNQQEGVDGYADTATAILLHSRKYAHNSSEETTNPYSRGCMLIGVGDAQFSEFMQRVQGRTERITIAYPPFRMKGSENRLVGQLIVDRTLATDYLIAIYGEAGTQKIRGE